MDVALNDKDGESLAHRTTKGAVWLVGWRVVQRLAGLFSSLILARLLLPADFGMLAMATTFVGLIDTLSEMGIDTALVRSDHTSRALFDTAFTMQLARSLLTALLLAGFSPWVAVWFDEPRLQAVLLVFAAIVAAGGFANIGTVEFRRNIEYRPQLALQAAPRLAQIVCSVAAALLLKSYWALMIGIAVGRLGGLVMGYVIHPYRPRLSLAAWRELVGFSFWSWASAMVHMLFERLDTFMLGSRFGAGVLGRYGLGQEVAQLPVSEVIDPMSSILTSAMSQLRRDGNDVVARVPELSAALLIIVAPMAITISAAASDVTEVLLGSRWHEAAPLVAIFAVVNLVQPLGYLMYAALIVTGNIRKDFEGLAFGVLLKFALLTAGLAMGGLEMVVAASVTATCLYKVILTYQLYRVGRPGFRAFAGAYLRIGLAILASAAVLYLTGLGWRVEDPDILTALWRTASVACVTVVVHGLVLGGGWWLTGRGDGPERLVVQAFGRALRRWGWA